MPRFPIDIIIEDGLEGRDVELWMHGEDGQQAVINAMKSIKLEPHEFLHVVHIGLPEREKENGTTPAKR